MMEYLCGWWYSLMVLYSKLLNPERLLPSWNSSLYSPSSISPIVVQAIWSGYLSKGSQGESDAIYGVCYIWCMLSNGLLYYIVEYPCRRLRCWMVLYSKRTNFVYGDDSWITMGSQGNRRYVWCIVIYWLTVLYCGIFISLVMWLIVLDSMLTNSVFSYIIP